MQMHNLSLTVDLMVNIMPVHKGSSLEKQAFWESNNNNLRHHDHQMTITRDCHCGCSLRVGSIKIFASLIKKAKRSLLCSWSRQETQNDMMMKQFAFACQFLNLIFSFFLVFKKEKNLLPKVQGKIV